MSNNKSLVYTMTLMTNMTGKTQYVIELNFEAIFF